VCIVSQCGAVDALAALGHDAHDNVREAALGALVEAKRLEAVEIALDALTRPDYQLLITASRALAGASRERAVPALLAALARVTGERRENSRDARMAILARLEEFGASDADTLRTYLADFDAAVARKAADMLTKWSGQAAVASPRPLSPPPVRFAELEALRSVRLRFVMAGRGTFDLRLLVDEAPVTALRVATRAREGYYNGLTFHRVVPNFVIQGGSPGANEYVGDAAFMRDEVGLVSHRRGTVGISTRGRDTGDAQIFVNLIDSPRLDHTYTVFADVVAGLDVVDAVLEGDEIERVELIQTTARRSSR
jgi:cyclophilin family peptidyl-prolyl cis-trans isomerase